MVHPAHHARLIDNEHQFYLQAGITIERLKYLLWDHLKYSKTCNAAQHRAALNDTKKPHRYFSECLTEISNRSLFDEHRSAYATVKRLWIARGIIAHGKELPKELGSSDLTSDVESLYTLAKFVDSIRGVEASHLVL